MPETKGCYILKKGYIDPLLLSSDPPYVYRKENQKEFSMIEAKESSKMCASLRTTIVSCVIRVKK